MLILIALERLRFLIVISEDVVGIMEYSTGTGSLDILNDWEYKFAGG